ncbi:type II toxin-antitoxin system VapC family toxin [Terriglobus sp.]|uniref:type II toxin-antitoxin system VapC family toxin n=1 Tax=Terriglobus sp. TaxID=1889013 RepID=UPI003AFFC9C9
MTYVMDTHTVIWAIEFPEKLSNTIREIVANENNVLLVSSMTAFELATKVRLGKLPAGEKLHANYESMLLGAGIGTVPVNDSIALRAGRLSGTHRDPFDRLIAATALAADLPLLSADEQMDAFHVRRVW